MPSYTNGNIPLALLVVFKRGWNATDGDWYHALSPATYARHLALIARALRRTGRLLSISLGWSAYRPLDAQWIARRIWGVGAAVPGTSSHGGFWEGRQTLAMDYGNWAWVYEYHGGYEAFADDCRAVGLTPGMIMRSRGYPDEPWHVIDLNPWSAVPAFEDATPFTPVKEEEPMTLMLRVKIPNGTKHTCLLSDGVFAHLMPEDKPDYVRDANKAEWVDADLAWLARLLRVFGCDKNIWDVRDGKFVVLDPLAGTVAQGNTWTADKAVRAAVAGIKIPTVDPSPLVAAVERALANVPAPELDEDAIIAGILAGLPDTATPVQIAKAVRDEFTSNPLR